MPGDRLVEVQEDLRGHRPGCQRARVGGSKRGLLLIFIAVFIGLHIIGALRWRSVG